MVICIFLPLIEKQKDKEAYTEYCLQAKKEHLLLEFLPLHLRRPLLSQLLMKAITGHVSGAIASHHMRISLSSCKSTIDIDDRHTFTH